MLPFEENIERRIKWEVSKGFTEKKNNVVGILMLLQSFFSLSSYFDVHKDLKTVAALVVPLGN